MHHCASLELPLGASMCVCISGPVYSLTKVLQALHPLEASPGEIIIMIQGHCSLSSKHLIRLHAVDDGGQSCACSG